MAEAISAGPVKAEILRCKRPHVLTARARLALRSGRAREAASLAEQALAAAPHAERYLILADALA